MRVNLHRIMLLLVAVFILMAAPTYAAPGDGYAQDKEFKIKSQLNTSIAITADNDKNYILDDKRLILGINPMADLANGLFKFYKLLIKSNIDIVVKAYKFDIYEKVSTFIDTLLEPVKKTVFDGFSGITISIAVAMLMYMLLSKSMASGSSSLIVFVLIVTFSLLFLAYPAKILDCGHDVMVAVSDNLIKNSFANSYGVSTTDDALAILSNRQWELMVERPWRMMNFSGDATLQSQYESQLLSTPFGDERNEIVSQMREIQPADTSSWIGTIFLMILLITFTILPIVALAGLMIASSALVLASTVLAPIIFCISYIPSFSRSFFTWFMRIFSFLGLTVVGTMGITLVLNLLDILYNATKTNNIISILLINMLIMISLFLFRNKIFGVVTSPIMGNRQFDRSIRERVNPYDQGVKDVDRLKMSYNWLKSKQGGDDGKGYNSNSKASSRFKSNAKDKGDNDYKKGGSSKQRKQYDSNHQESEPKQEKWTESQYRKTANEFLEERYKTEKSRAEKNARTIKEKTGMEVNPEYSEYVKSRIARNKKFQFTPEQSDVLDAMNRMKTYEKAGRSPSEIFNELRDDYDPDTMGAKDKYKSKSFNESHENKQAHKNAGVEFEWRDDMTSQELGKAYLQAQYKLNQEKANNFARNEATRTGTQQAPVYDSFVQQSNRRIREGHNQFSRAEIDAAADHVETLKQSGVEPRTYMQSMTAEDMSSYVGLKDQEKVSIKDVKAGGKNLSDADISRIADQAAKKAVKEVQSKKGEEKSTNTNKPAHEWHKNAQLTDRLEDINEKMDRINEDQNRMREDMTSKLRKTESSEGFRNKTGDLDEQE